MNIDIHLYGYQFCSRRLSLMSFFLYLSDKKDLGDRVLKVLETFVPQMTVEMFGSLGDLSRRLRKPHFNIKVMVFFAVSRADLQGFLGLSEFLGDKKLILVLPDRDAETIAQAHKLKPRFITWLDSDFSDLGTVLKRMLKLYDHPHEGWIGRHQGMRRTSRANDERPS
jgi:hypothetical protein